MPAICTKPRNTPAEDAHRRMIIVHRTRLIAEVCTCSAACAQTVASLASLLAPESRAVAVPCICTDLRSDQGALLRGLRSLSDVILSGDLDDIEWKIAEAAR
jgi:hypothetical protein